MDRKERVRAYIASKEYIPLREDELAAVLDVPAEDREKFSAVLKELLAEGHVFLTQHSRYMPCKAGRNIIKGKLSCKPRGGYGVVLVDGGGEIYVKVRSMNGAIDGDTVLVKAGEQAPGYTRREGWILSVLHRAHDVVIGEFVSDNASYYRLRPDDRRIFRHIYVGPYDMMDAEIGDRAAVEITKYGEDHIYGRVIMSLGPAEYIKGQIEGIVIENGIRQNFPEEATEEAEAVPETVSEEEIKDRLDLRDELIFTIDGDDAKDFDDAVSVGTAENGNYILGVHIADVSHYVKEGSALDREAMLRSTSVYLPDRVVPMLPERLSNGICSLKPGEDRLTLSVIVEIDKDGKTVSHRLERSVIRSKARMTYSIASAILEGGEELAQSYEYLVPALEKMRGLAEILGRMRSGRGAMDFDFPETKITVDENSEPVELTAAERGVSNKIIEEFMLTANEIIAEYACSENLPFVYRTHEPPSEDKLNEYKSFIAHFGLRLDGGPVKPKQLQSIMENAKGTPEEKIIASTTLRSLMKAEYKPENLGHFGLSAKYYCHFTSPIRRYPDLFIHRVLKAYAEGSPKAAKQKGFRSMANSVSRHATEAETAAETAERDVDELLKTAYMRRFMGREFKAVIERITRYGMFVELENTVRGFIRAEYMSADYFDYDAENDVFTGERTGVTYRVGDEVDVVLMRADVYSRQIDFVLTEDRTAENIRIYKNMDGPKLVRDTRPPEMRKEKKKKKKRRRR